MRLALVKRRQLDLRTKLYRPEVVDSRQLRGRR